MDQKILKKDSFYLFKLFGFEVRLDWTWFFLAILITWTLAAGYFPLRSPGLSKNVYWVMGIIGAAGLFISIILHELSHSLVGRYYGVPISGITLFIFGGIAEMRDEPPSPKAEFLMSIAGPLLSITLGIGFYLLLQLGYFAKWPTPFNAVIGYLSMINFIVGIFNLFPGFPLDGGRVLRSILWWWKNDLVWATKISYRGGIGLAYGLIFLGILQFIYGALIAGLWMFLLGFFLQYLSRMSYNQLIIKQFFQGKTLKKYAKMNPISVESNITIQDLVNNFFYKYYHRLYPVTENGKLVGCVSFNEIRQIDQDKWPEFQVSQIMLKCSPDNTMDVHTDVSKALQIMSVQKLGRMVVTDHGKLYGMITLKDLMDVISIKLTLEERE